MAPASPPDFVEVGERDRVRRPPSEQLGHRVLHERQRTGLQLGLGDDPVDERRLDLDADARRPAAAPRRPARPPTSPRGRPCGRGWRRRTRRSRAAGRSSRRATWRRGERSDRSVCATSTSIRRNARRSASSIVWVNSSSNWSTTTSTPALPAARARRRRRRATRRRQRARRRRRGASTVATRLERRGQLLERLAARNHLGDEPALRAGDRPRARAPAASPALTADDLPMPDGPTTTSSALVLGARRPSRRRHRSRP